MLCLPPRALNSLWICQLWSHKLCAKQGSCQPPTPAPPFPLSQCASSINFDQGGGIPQNKGSANAPPSTSPPGSAQAPLQLWSRRLTASNQGQLVPAGQEVCTLLHVATFGSVIACLLRHFRTSLASLPLISQPVGNLPIGTWSPSSSQAQQEEGAMPEVTLVALRIPCRGLVKDSICPLCSWLLFQGSGQITCLKLRLSSSSPEHKNRAPAYAFLTARLKQNVWV